MEEIPKVKYFNAIVIGSFGAGKTSLINSLCNQNFTVGNGLNSETKYEDIGKNVGDWSRSKTGTRRVKLIDTPGSHSSELSVVKLLLCHLAVAIASEDINKIIVCVSATERLHDTTERFIQILKETFNDWSNNFILLFTKFDAHWKTRKNQPPGTFLEWYEKNPQQQKEFFSWFPEKYGFSSEVETPYAKSQQMETKKKLWKSIIRTKQPITNSEIKNIHNTFLIDEEVLLQKAIEELYKYSPSWKIVCAIPVVGLISAGVFHCITLVQEAKLRKNYQEEKITKTQLFEKAKLTNK